MKAPIQQDTYITTSSCIMQKKENSQLIYSPFIELDKTIKNHQGDNVILIAATAKEPYRLIEKAYQLGIKVYFTDTLTYDFTGAWNESLNKELNLIRLLLIAREPVFLDVAINIIFENFKHKIPSTMDLDEVLKLIGTYTSPSLDICAAIELFKSLYTNHVNSICKLIEPDFNHPLIEIISLSYEHELSNYLITNNGLFGLLDRMGGYKTTRGIIPTYEHYSNCSTAQAILIAPTISLTRSLQETLNQNTSSNNKYHHYLDLSEKDEVSDLPSLISCVDSAMTNEELIKYGQNCDIVIVDEVQSCVNALADRRILSGKLSERANATSNFYDLLKQPKVLFADALLADSTMKKIIEHTGRKITILRNTDEIPKNQKEVHIFNRYDHVEKIILQATDSNCEVGFCDGGQKISTAFFDFKDIINNSLEGDVLVVNADFLKTKDGREFLLDPLSSIIKATFTLFSPAVTCGQNFPFKQFKRTNLLAHETISPLQLLQSSVRFRNAHKIQISFVGKFSGFHDDFDGIRNFEIFDTTKFSEFPYELEYAENNVWCDYIIEQIIQENQLRQNYKNNTLILYQHLGAKIVKHSDEIKESTKKNKKLKYDDDIEIIPISRKRYTQLKQRLAFLTDDEKEQIYIFELFDFFNILEKPELYIETLKFDETGKARTWMKNLYLCRNADKQDDVTTLDKIKEIVTLKVLGTLGIDINTFEGVYGSKEISELERFIHKGEITLHGKKLKMRKIKNKLFDIPSKKYKSNGPFAKAIIGKFLGLTHEFVSRKRTKDIDESFYQVSTESKILTNSYFEMTL
jgi:hypothetical protein